MYNQFFIQDFATSSLKGEVAAENEEEIPIEEMLQEYQIDERKQWEQRYNHMFMFLVHLTISFVD